MAMAMLSGKPRTICMYDGPAEGSTLPYSNADCVSKRWVVCSDLCCSTIMDHGVFGSVLLFLYEFSWVMMACRSAQKIKKAPR